MSVARSIATHRTEEVLLKKTISNPPPLKPRAGSHNHEIPCNLLDWPWEFKEKVYFVLCTLLGRALPRREEPVSRLYNAAGDIPVRRGRGAAPDLMNHAYQSSRVRGSPLLPRSGFAMSTWYTLSLPRWNSYAEPDM